MAEPAEHRNHLGQPIGPPLPDWTPRPHPPHTELHGRLCRLEPADLVRGVQVAVRVDHRVR